MRLVEDTDAKLYELVSARDGISSVSSSFSQREDGGGRSTIRLGSEGV